MLGIFLDQETLGLDSMRHKVIAVAFLIIDLTTGKEIARYEQIIKQDSSDWQARDPMSIAIHGYTYEDLLQGKMKEEICKEVVTIFQESGIQRGKSVFICQNPSFDRPFFSQIVPTYTQEKLNWPYHWLDLASMYWVRIVDAAKNENKGLSEQYTLAKDSIAAAYQISPEKKPHKAMQGVEHLVTCYKQVVGFLE